MASVVVINGGKTNAVGVLELRKPEITEEKALWLIGGDSTVRNRYPQAIEEVCRQLDEHRAAIGPIDLFGPYSSSEGPFWLVFAPTGDRQDDRVARLKFGASICERATQIDAQRICLDLPVADSALADIIEGCEMASLSIGAGAKVENQQRRYIFSPTNSQPGAWEKLWSRRQARLDGLYLARRVTAQPANLCSPQAIADEAMLLAKRNHIEGRVFDRKELQEKGFGGILAVGQGSLNEPCLVSLEYRPERPGGRHRVLLVGKGVTFDSGGYNLKAGPQMEKMHMDMAAAGVLLGVAEYIAKMRLAVEVAVLLPCAENAIGPASIRPGDKIETYGGKTVEVKNTDAEGRILLADAIAYGIERYQPTIVVDIATLTGACFTALGSNIAGYFSNREEFGRLLEEASRESGEMVWRLPLYDPYRPLLRARAADLTNLSERKWGGGLITSALFIEEFVGKQAWIHLDIAGPALGFYDDPCYSKSMATGFGVNLMSRFLEKLTGHE